MRLIIATCLILLFNTGAVQACQKLSFIFASDPLDVADQDAYYQQLSDCYDIEVALLEPEDQQHLKAELLMTSAKENDVVLAQLALDNGADVNGSAGPGLTPLVVATKWAKIEMISFLLGAGADPDVGYPDTAVIQAISGNDEQVLKMLFDAGATGRIPPDRPAGTTLFEFLAISDLGTDVAPVVRVLIDQGIDPFQVDHLGASPLQVAILRYQFNMLDLLVDVGVDLNAPLNGWPPLALIGRYEQDLSVIAYLIHLGADPTLLNDDVLGQFDPTVRAYIEADNGVERQEILDRSLRDLSKTLNFSAIRSLLRVGANPNRYAGQENLLYVWGCNAYQGTFFLNAGAEPRLAWVDDEPPPWLEACAAVGSEEAAYATSLGYMLD